MNLTKVAALPGSGGGAVSALRLEPDAKAEQVAKDVFQQLCDGLTLDPTCKPPFEFAKPGDLVPMQPTETFFARLAKAQTKVKDLPLQDQAVQMFQRAQQASFERRRLLVYQPGQLVDPGHTHGFQARPISPGDHSHQLVDPGHTHGVLPLRPRVRRSTHEDLVDWFFRSFEVVEGPPRAFYNWDRATGRALVPDDHSACRRVYVVLGYRVEALRADAVERVCGALHYALDQIHAKHLMCSEKPVAVLRRHITLSTDNGFLRASVRLDFPNLMRVDSPAIVYEGHLMHDADHLFDWS